MVWKEECSQLERMANSLCPAARHPFQALVEVGKTADGLLPATAHEAAATDVNVTDHAKRTAGNARRALVSPEHTSKMVST